VIIARWLGPAGTGIVSALAVITLIAINVAGFGLPSAITFLVARDRSTTKPVLMNSATFGIVSGTVVAAAIILIGILRPSLLGDVPTNLLIIVAAALPLQLLSFLVLGIYLGLQRIGTYVVIEIALQSIILITAVIILVVLGSDVFVLVTAGAIANAAAGVIFTLILATDLREMAGEWRFDRGPMREMLTYGSRFFVAMAAGLVILRGDLLIVNYFRGSAEAGIYAVATQASLFLHMLPNVISTVFFPRSADAKDESGQLTCRVTRASVFIMLAICVAAIPLAFVLPVLYGPAFTGLPTLFLILLPGVFLLGIETIQVQHFTGLGLPRVIPGFWVGTMILVIGLDVLLVPSWGAYAAAAVSTFGYVVIFGLVAIYFCLRTGRSLSECFVPRAGELAGIFKGAILRESKT